MHQAREYSGTYNKKTNKKKKNFYLYSTSSKHSYKVPHNEKRIKKNDLEP